MRSLLKFETVCCAAGADEAIIGSAIGAIELAELVVYELSCSQNSPLVVGSRQMHL